MKKYFALLVLSGIFISGCRSSIVDDPSVNIRFLVDQNSIVTLTIENDYNTVMATPVDHEAKAAGYYSVNIDGSSWLSGVYFYTIEYKGINSNYYYKTTKKMLIIK
jgi:hypothetical protein